MYSCNDVRKRKAPESLTSSPAPKSTRMAMSDYWDPEIMDYDLEFSDPLGQGDHLSDLASVTESAPY